MKYFTIEELTASSTAKAKGIDNTPTPEVVERMTRLVENLLDVVREVWGTSITVNSGFRCLALNKSVGGAPTSQHVKGEAADITVGSKVKNRELFMLILALKKAGRIEFDQLINESNFSWIHVSLKKEGNRNQVLAL